MHPQAVTGNFTRLQLHGERVCRPGRAYTERPVAGLLGERGEHDVVVSIGQPDCKCRRRRGMHIAFQPGFANVAPGVFLDRVKPSVGGVRV